MVFSHKESSDLLECTSLHPDQVHQCRVKMVAVSRPYGREALLLNIFVIVRAFSGFIRARI